MIQRIQTLYLLLATISVALMFVFPILKLEKKEKGGGEKFAVIYEVNTYGIKAVDVPEDKVNYISETDDSPLVGIIIGISGILTLVSIFLFKFRIVQINLSRLAVLTTVIAGVVAFFDYAYNNLIRTADVMDFGPGFFIPLIIVVFTLLAISGIQKDEDLIKAADRVR
ncbi:MAG: hypothetical protein ACJATA_001865 [Sphingobacteriales bacterium]|jgi:hypothetical protein